MSQSIIYRSVHGYELVMRALYGRHYAERMRLVAEQVPPGASVLELCCGPGTMFTRYLRGRVGSYIGLDVNAGFVQRLRRAGVDARVADLAHGSDPLPQADVAIIQASLYHFLPAPERIIDRMIAAARERAIISEPIRNLRAAACPWSGGSGDAPRIPAWADTSGASTSARWTS